MMPFDREDERKGQASKTPCSIPAATLQAKIESLGPVGGRVSVIAPLPDRLPGLIEGSYDHSLLSSTVFLVVISL